MNYFNVTAIMLASIGMRIGWGGNTYSDVWEYFEIKMDFNGLYFCW